MSSAVFIDTSGWFAAVSARERHHTEVAVVYDDLASRGVPLLTTNLVVAEMHALVVRERGALTGCALLDAIYTDPAYRVITSTRELESDATARWLRPFGEHRFSITDAVSFEVMRLEGITEALSLDHHFEIAGYRTLPAALPRSGRRRR